MKLSLISTTFNNRNHSPIVTPMTALSPANIDTEQSILGGILLDTQAFSRISKILEVKHFYSTAHQKIFRACQELFMAGMPTDMTSVYLRLEKNCELEAAGGMAAIANLVNKTVSAVNIDRYAELIIDKWRLRELLSAFYEGIEKVGERGVFSSEVLESILPRIKAFEKENPSTSLYNLLDEYLDEPDFYKALKFKKRIQNLFKINRWDFDHLLAQHMNKGEDAENQVSSLEEFFKTEDNENEWLIPEFLAKNSMILLAAPAKCGKTLLSLDLLHSILAGSKFLNQSPQKTGKVLYIQADESRITAKNRLFERGFDLLCGNHSMFVKLSLSLANLKELELFLKKNPIDLIVVDNLTTITKNLGVSENDSAIAHHVYRLKRLCEKYNSALVLIHHENKDGFAKGGNKIAGSSRLLAIPESIWQLSAMNPNDQKDSRRKLNITQRSGPSLSFLIQLNPQHEWIDKGCYSFISDNSDSSGSDPSISKSIIRLLEKHPLGLRGVEITKALGGASTIRKVLAHLCYLGKVIKKKCIKDKRGRIYSLPQTKEKVVLIKTEKTNENVIQDDDVVEKNEKYSEKSDHISEMGTKPLQNKDSGIRSPSDSDMIQDRICSEVDRIPESDLESSDSKDYNSPNNRSVPESQSTSENPPLLKIEPEITHDTTELWMGKGVLGNKDSYHHKELGIVIGIADKDLVLVKWSYSEDPELIDIHLLDLLE